MKVIDIFTQEDYENINLDYPDGYLEELVKVLEQENKQLKEELEMEKQINVEDLKTIDRQQEIIQELRADYGNKAQVERDMLEEGNRQLKEKIDKIQELFDNYEKLEEVIGAGKPKFPLYKIQEILKGE